MAEDSQIPKKVLVVCTGNTCRSPMAAGWLMQKLAGKGWTAESAGVAAWGGTPASPAALAVMREIGIDLSAHRSRKLTRKLADEATFILAMTDGHRREIARHFPETAGKIHLVHGFGLEEERDVLDPIGLPEDVYRHVRDELIQALGDFLLFLADRGELNR